MHMRLADAATSVCSSFLGEVEDILIATGYPVDVISYGFEFDGYEPEDFRAILDECVLAVFISKSESQVCTCVRACVPVRLRACVSVCGCLSN
jgi:hypothetical protein